MPPMPDNINFGRFNDDFRADFSHKNICPKMLKLFET
jgi:hypothetical protein